MIKDKGRIILYIVLLAICIGIIFFLKIHIDNGKEVAEEKNNTNKSVGIEEYKLKEEMKVYNDSNKEKNKEDNDVRKIEFLPFKAGIEKGVDFILVSHLSAPNITGSDVPASLSSTIVKDLLRDELNYKNIIITDALNMGAVSLNYYPGEAAIEAIKAGVDILLMSPNFEDVFNQVIQAVNEDIISEERVDESVRRILRVKLNRNIINLE